MNVQIQVQGPLVLVQRDLDTFSVRGAVVLVGAGYALVWDTLASPSDMREVAPHLAGREVTVVYSHADWDHCWGTAGLDPLDLRAIVAHRAAAGRFTHELPGLLDEMRLAEPGKWDDVRLDAPNELLEKGLTLDVGGLTVQLECIPGHCADSLVGFLPDLGVLLAGDVAEDPLPEVRQPDALAEWAEALERWSVVTGLTAVVPGHGAVSGPELLNRNARYLRALAAGRGPDAHPEPLSGYYREVHAANVAAVAAWVGGPDRGRSDGGDLNDSEGE